MSEKCELFVSPVSRSSRGAFWMVVLISLAFWSGAAVAQAVCTDEASKGTCTTEASHLDLYLSPYGDDGNDGLSPERPLLTLQQAATTIRRTLSGRERDVTVHVAGGTYPNQRTRWNFSMPHKTITIQGEPGSRPVFDGSGMRNLDAYPKGQIEWMSITRDSAERAYEATNIVIRGLQVQNYLTAIAIRGGRSGERHYPASDGGNIIKDNRFLHIGGAYSRLDNGPKVSHAAIFLSRSRLNLIRNNDFINITNDAKFPPDYSTYGGLHAVYITSFSSGNVVEGNTFDRIYARGVIKFRDFSNFGRVRGNKFHDDTSLLIDQYCDEKLPVCATNPQRGCPSWGIEFTDNAYTLGRVRSTVVMAEHAANDAYCQSAEFWKDSGLDPTDPLNSVKGVARLVHSGNVRGRLAPVETRP